MTGPSTHQDSPKVPECELPPKGWRCTRGAGHDGSCAAVPVGGFVADDLDRPSHGQIWLDKESGFTVGVLNVSGDGPMVSGNWHRGLDLDDGFVFPLAEFTSRFLPLAVDPSCTSLIPVPVLLSDEVLSRVLGELEVLGWSFQADEANAAVDLRSALQAAIEHVGGAK